MEINNYPILELEEIHQATKVEAEEFNGKTVLILGGSGFIGSALKAYFLFLNRHVLIHPMTIISVDNYIGRARPIEINEPNLIHIEHDLVLPIEDKLPHTKLDYIINASGNASPSNYAVHSLETIDISVNAVRFLLRLARAHGAKILNFSSSEVLGTPPDDKVPTTEDYIPQVHTMNPRACYDVGKMMIETLSWIYKTRYQTDVKVVRLFNCVGRFRQDDFRVFPNFISAALKKQPIRVFAPGLQTRTFSYYTDVIAGCIKVLISGKDLLYHIGNSDNEITMIEFAQRIEKVSGQEGKLIQLIPTPEVYAHEPLRRCPSIEKAQKELGYNPVIDVDEMVQRIFTWAQKHYQY